MHRAFQTLEQILVVDDVAVFLVVAIQPVDPADGLEQPVVPHLLVDVEIGGRGRIEAGEQLVHHDQQLHLPRLVDEFLLHLLLELLDLVDGLLRRLVEPVGQHLVDRSRTCCRLSVSPSPVSSPLISATPGA